LQALPCRLLKAEKANTSTKPFGASVCAQSFKKLHLAALRQCSIPWSYSVGKVTKNMTRRLLNFYLFYHKEVIIASISYQIKEIKENKHFLIHLPGN